MTQSLLRAAATLAAVLTAENAALVALDITRAAQLVIAKREAAGAFAGAHAHLAATGHAGNGQTDAATRDALAAALRHLHSLAAENRLLLERAIATQTRVLDIIANAVPRASAQAPRYSPRGALVGRNHAPPVAIAASA